MKTYQELTDEQKEKAVEQATVNVLEEISGGILSFDDERNGDDLQERIDNAFEKAEKMKTPWFVHEYIMDACAEEVTGLAQSQAELCLYSEPGEIVVNGII